MKYKNLIFDLDGTLLDTSIGIKEAVRFTIKTLGYRELEDKEIASFIGPPIQDSLIKHFGCSKDGAQKGANVFRDYYKDVSLLKAVPYDGIYDLMEYLIKQDIKVSVATYKREDYAIQLLKAYHFDDYCSVMHGADNNNIMTKADIIKLCLEQIDGKADESLYVGDTMSDYNSAADCGMDFIGATYGFGFKKYEVYDFQTIQEPIKLIKLLAL